MLYKNFIEKYKHTAKSIPLYKTGLTEKIHISAALNHRKHPDILQPDCLVVVKRATENLYTLLAGWASYMSALDNAYYEINAIVVDDICEPEFTKKMNRGKFLTLVSAECETKHISDLRIAPEIAKTLATHPNSREKINCCKKRFKADRHFGKTVYIDEDNNVLDGFTAVVAADELGIPNISVVQTTRKIWENDGLNKGIRKTVVKRNKLKDRQVKRNES